MILVCVILILIVVLFHIRTKHTVIVSMTTIPERIEDGRIHKTIHSVLTQSYPVDAFHINIPHETRKKKPYPEDKIKELQRLYPTVTIHRVEKDLGPITKLVPTLQHMRVYDYVVLVDDDVVYEKDMIRNLVDSGLDAVGYAGRVDDMVFTTSDTVSRPTPCVFLETYAGVLYRTTLFDAFDEDMTVCPNQDDIVIGHHLKRHNIPRYIIASQFQCHHDGNGSPELRNENLEGGNQKCFESLFK